MCTHGTTRSVNTHGAWRRSGRPVRYRRRRRRRTQDGRSFWNTCRRWPSFCALSVCRRSGYWWEVEGNSWRCRRFGGNRAGSTILGRLKHARAHTLGDEGGVRLWALGRDDDDGGGDNDDNDNATTGTSTGWTLTGRRSEQRLFYRRFHYSPPAPTSAAVLAASRPPPAVPNEFPAVRRQLAHNLDFRLRPPEVGGFYLYRTNRGIRGEKTNARWDTD